MRVKFEKLSSIFLIFVCLTAVFACTKKSVPIQPGSGGGAFGGSAAAGPGAGGPGGAYGGLDDPRWRELGINSEPERREFLQAAQEFENEDIYFDFDSYVLSQPAKAVLDDKLQFIKRYPKIKVTIEGHCDERGTNEYNIALGDRRANSALQYLVNAGLGQQSIGTVSYGEERPIGGGNDEASMAKNRRAHFVLNY